MPRGVPAPPGRLVVDRQVITAIVNRQVDDYGDHVLELMGVAEIAELLGVTRQRVNQLVHESDRFPAPVAVLSAGRIWLQDDIQRWVDAGMHVNTSPGQERKRGK